MIANRIVLVLISLLFFIACGSKAEPVNELMNFSVPPGFKFDLFFFENQGEVNFRKKLDSGKFSAISFRKGYNQEDMDSLKKFGFKAVENCGKRSVLMNVSNELYELTSHIYKDVYIHAVNLSQSDVEYLSNYICSE